MLGSRRRQDHIKFRERTTDLEAAINAVGILLSAHTSGFSGSCRFEIDDSIDAIRPCQALTAAAYAAVMRADSERAP